MRELALIEAISGALARRDGSRVVRWLGDDAAVVRGDAFAIASRVGARPAAGPGAQSYACASSR